MGRQETEAFLRKRLEQQQKTFISGPDAEMLAVALHNAGVSEDQINQGFSDAARMQREALERRLADDPLKLLEVVLNEAATTHTDQMIAEGMVARSRENRRLWVVALSRAKQQLHDKGLPDDLNIALEATDFRLHFERPTQVVWGQPISVGEMYVPLGGFSDVWQGDKSLRPSEGFVLRTFNALEVTNGFRRAHKTFEQTFNVDPIPSNVLGLYLDAYHSRFSPGGRFVMDMESVIKLVE